MRIRVLELPSEQVGDYYHTPFVLVLDHMPEPLSAEQAQRISESFKAATGARGVLIIGLSLGEAELE